MLQSCILFESDEERDRKNSYSCSLNVKINNWNKSVRECNYLISYTNSRSYTSTGYFQLTMRSNTSTYIVKTAELTLEDGNHSIPIEINSCKFQDEVTAVCFMTR